MTQIPEALAVEAADKIEELIREKKSLQQQCADFAEALTKEQLITIQMLEALERAVAHFEVLLTDEPGSVMDQMRKAIQKAKSCKT